VVFKLLGGSLALGNTRMNALSLCSVAAVTVALLCSPASAAAVIDLGPVLNNSISLLNTSDTKTAGKGDSFWDSRSLRLSS
jgi:hypothetical protein